MENERMWKMTATRNQSKVLGFCGALAAAMLLAFAGMGCATGMATPKKPITHVPPVPDGYYTGNAPDFAFRFNPDPLGRKFRVAHLLLDFSNWESGKTARECANPAAVAILYLPLREQAAQSPRAVDIRRKNGEQSIRDLCKTFYGPDGLVAGTLNRIANASSTTETDRAFLQRHWHDMDALNRELERHYPNLFSTEESAFPLDVVVTIVFDSTLGKRKNSLYEGWLVGVPEHARIVEKKADGRAPDYFPATEAFTNPCEAIAAALFKLGDEEFEGLERANPRDYEWLEEK